jgi:hypothetical protein
MIHQSGEAEVLIYVCVNPEALDFRRTPELQNDFRTLEDVKYLFQARLGSHFL